MSSFRAAPWVDRDPSPRLVVHLFPGQGDFSVSPLVRAARSHEPVRKSIAEVFEQAEEVGSEFGIAPLGKALLSDSPPSGRDLAAACVGTPQLALFCSSVAVHRALCELGLAPDQVLGVSFGEIAALTAAGVFQIAEGARIACLLARQLAYCEGGMTLIGAGESRTRTLLYEARLPDLALACVNDPDETVLSGPLPDLRAVEERALRQGVPAARLRLPFSSHHPALTGPADAFAASIRHIPARPTCVPVFSAVHGGAYRRGDDIHRALANCLINPAHLPNVLHQLTSRHTALFFEAGTGRSLTRNAQHTLPPSAALAYAPLADPGFPWPHANPPTTPRSGTPPFLPRGGAG